MSQMSTLLDHLIDYGHTRQDTIQYLMRINELMEQNTEANIVDLENSQILIFNIGSMTSERPLSNNFLRNALLPYYKGISTNKSSLDFSTSHLDHVKVTPEVITFQYRGGHNQYLYNRELRIINNSDSKIYFKIKSNNPQSYEVFPYKEAIEKNRSCEIRIKLLMNSRNPAKYNDDKFLVEWGFFEEKLIRERTQQFPHSDNISRQNLSALKRKTLRVKIQFQRIEREIYTEKKKEENEIMMYKQILNSNQEKIAKLNQEIQLRERHPSKTAVLSKTVLFAISLFAFFLGYSIA